MSTWGYLVMAIAVLILVNVVFVLLLVIGDFREYWHDRRDRH